mmetsp:Transcript_9684/g.17684  ORF Transcript_9684/g.17684 Transcript_9684/m.17684 type:complete len:304 (+) Transcript_9684:2911-3822(+)
MLAKLHMPLFVVIELPTTSLYIIAILFLRHRQDRRPGKLEFVVVVIKILGVPIITMLLCVFVAMLVFAFFEHKRQVQGQHGVLTKLMPRLLCSRLALHLNQFLQHLVEQLLSDFVSVGEGLHVGLVLRLAGREVFVPVCFDEKLPRVLHFAAPVPLPPRVRPRARARWLRPEPAPLRRRAGREFGRFAFAAFDARDARRLIVQHGKRQNAAAATGTKARLLLSGVVILSIFAVMLVVVVHGCCSRDEDRHRFARRHPGDVPAFSTAHATLCLWVGVSVSERVSVSVGVIGRVVVVLAGMLVCW